MRGGSSTMSTADRSGRPVLRRVSAMASPVWRRKGWPFHRLLVIAPPMMRRMRIRRAAGNRIGRPVSASRENPGGRVAPVVLGGDWSIVVPLSVDFTGYVFVAGRSMIAGDVCVFDRDRPVGGDSAALAHSRRSGCPGQSVQSHAGGTTRVARHSRRAQFAGTASSSSRTGGGIAGDRDWNVRFLPRFDGQDACEQIEASATPGISVRPGRIRPANSTRIRVPAWADFSARHSLPGWFDDHRVDRSSEESRQYWVRIVLLGRTIARRAEVIRFSAGYSPELSGPEGTTGIGAGVPRFGRPSDSGVCPR